MQQVSHHGFAEQWKVIEQIKKDGLAKSIGVSNFREEDLLAFENEWEIPPAVNQVSGAMCARMRDAHGQTKSESIVSSSWAYIQEPGVSRARALHCARPAYGDRATQTPHGG